MEISKKLNAAITVAAIAGTCAFSSPSFAAWTSDPPSSIDSDIIATVADPDTTDGMFAVGTSGRTYFMNKATMEANSPTWTKASLAITSNFVGIDFDGDTYFAVTANGKLATNDAADATWTVFDTATIVDAGAKAIIEGGNIVGIACTGTAKIAVVTSEGKVAYCSNTADLTANWSDISHGTGADGLLDEANIITNGIKGIASVTKGKTGVVGVNDIFYVFGATNGAKDQDNFLIIGIDGAVDTKANLGNLGGDKCSTVNAVCPILNAAGNAVAGFYVAGESGQVALVAANLASATSLTAATPATANLKAIKYDPTETYGYVAGEGGVMYRIDDSQATNKLVPVADTTTTNNLNTVSMLLGATEGAAPAKTGVRRTFASGADGASIYNNEMFWSATDGANAPTAPLAITAGDSTVFVFESAQLLASEAPGTAWKVGAEGGSAEAPTGTSTVYHNIDATHRYIFAAGDAGTTGKVASYLYDGTTITGLNVDATTPNADFITKAGASTLVIAQSLANVVPSTVNIASADFTGAVTATDAGIVIDGVIAVQGIAGTTNGIYALVDAVGVIPVTAIKTLAVTATNVLSLDFAEAANNSYVTPLGLTGDAAFGSVTDITLSSTTDGNLIVICKAGALKIVVAEEDMTGAVTNGDATDAATYTVTDMGYPTGLTNAPVKAWGTKTDMFMTDGTDVYRYTNGAWTKYDDITAAVAAMTAAGISGVASYTTGSVVAIDPDAAAYSAGADFSSVGTSDFPVNTDINTTFNATTTEIYVGGDDGLLVKGTKTSATNIDWATRYTDTFFGTKDVKAVSGASDEIFAAYGPDGSEGFAHKTDAATTWTEVTTIGGAATVNVVNDMQALDATNVFVADSTGGGLVKGNLADASTLNFTDQTSGSGAVMPASLSALRVLDANNIYGVTGTKLYKFTSPSGDAWAITDVALTSPETLQDVVAISEAKVYAVGNNGYAVSYDGTTATKLAAITGTPNLTTCWAYGDILYAADDAGKVHTYNVETAAWTSETVRAGKALADITGCSKGKYLFTVGADRTAYLDEINTSGGGSTETPASAASGDTAVVSAQNPASRSAATLSTTYGTPADMSVVSPMQEFTTTGGVASGSTHTFTYNFTPAANYAFNDLVLYKLKTDGTNLSYNSLSAAPASATSGDFWITTAVGAAVGAGDTLASGTTYSVFFALADGSDYDNDTTAGKITDPTVLGTSSGDSSSSGCVFNPTQTFGMEWLLLAFAPIAVFFRSRFKK